jgi:hypothetical protein
MSDVASTVDTYLAMWNETDPARRANRFRRVSGVDVHHGEKPQRYDGGGLAGPGEAPA